MTIGSSIKPYAIALGLAIAFGLAQLAVGSALLSREEALFDLGEDAKVLSLAQAYSRELLTGCGDKAEKNALLAESETIARRGAFLAAYARFKGELALRWTLLSSAFVAALAAAALCLVAALSRSFERERVRLGAQRAQAQWRITGRVLAHEIKNALSPMSIDVDYLLAQGGAEPKCLARMRKNVDRVARMVDSLKGFSELPEPAFRDASVGATLSLAAEQAGLAGLLEDAELRALERRKAYTDPEYLSIVFANILKNAKEAGARSVSARWSKDALVLADDGPGMTPAIEEAMAREGPRPGLTTKEGGDGMGLYIVFELCRMLGIRVITHNAPRGVEISMEFARG